MSIANGGIRTYYDRCQIRCKNMRFSFDHNKLISVSSFEILENSKIWLYGASGSGKSTFLSLLAGILKPSSGSLSISGFDFIKESQSKVDNFRHQHISYVHQENHFVDHWTGLQNLQTFTSATKLQIGESFDQVSLRSDFLKRPVISYSGGQRQLLSLAKTLLQKKKILFLDEPTAHLDDASFARFIYLIQNNFKDCTVIVVSHDSRLSGTLFTKTLFQEINQ